MKDLLGDSVIWVDPNRNVSTSKLRPISKENVANLKNNTSTSGYNLSFTTTGEILNNGDVHLQDGARRCIVVKQSMSKGYLDQNFKFMMMVQPSKNFPPNEIGCEDGTDNDLCEDTILAHSLGSNEINRHLVAKKEHSRLCFLCSTHQHSVFNK